MALERVPGKLSKLLGTRQWQELRCSAPPGAEQHLFWQPNVLPSNRVGSVIGLLERRVRQHVRDVRSPLPDPYDNGAGNYGEVLPKVMRLSTVELNNPRTRAARTARDIGLVDLLRSNTTRELAAHLSGAVLGRRAGCQVTRYQEGDYVGPHHDGHPDDVHLRRGYVDLHLTLCSAGVGHQWLAYQRGGHLEGMVNVGARSGISVSRLPFWHYTTPLVSKPGRGDAIRWLLWRHSRSCPTNRL